MKVPKTKPTIRSRAETLTKIRIALFDIGIEQADLAKAAGITPQYLNNMFKLAQKIKYGRAGDKPKLPMSDKKIADLVNTFDILKLERNEENERRTTDR